MSIATARSARPRPTLKKLDIVLDRGSRVPLYHQLAQAIEAAISAGQLEPGDQVENEHSLTRLGLSRPTVRQALGELSKKGLVIRKRGSGTQVLNRELAEVSRDDRLSSLHDDLAAAGRRPTTEVLEIGADLTPDDIDLLRNANAGTDLLKIRRLRRASDQPVALLTNYVPLQFGITATQLTTQGLYQSLRAANVRIRLGYQRIHARLLTDTEAELLAEQPPTAGLEITRTVYDDSGDFVELGHHIYRASQYSMNVSLTT